MAATILLFIYTQHEFSYDRFHTNYERIYRLNSTAYESKEALPICLNLMDSVLQKSVPEIEELFQIYGYGRVEFVNEDIHFKKIELIFSDPNIHKVFTLKYLNGNPDKALTEPRSLVLTRSVATKMFGSIDVVGRIVKSVDFQDNYTVTGVIEDFPSTSHIKFGAIAPLEYFPSLKYFDGLELLTYIKYKEKVNIEDGIKKVDAKYNEILTKRFGKDGFSNSGFQIRVKDLHLKADFNSKNGFDAPLKKVYIYIAMALIVLLIAIINFINLLTVQYEGRFREIGVRKAIGSSRKEIIIHFLGQSIAFSFIALVIAAIMVEFFIPAFGSMLNRDLLNTYRNNIILIIGLPLLAFITGIVSGLYPALIISKYPPYLAIKGLMNSRKGVSRFTRALVILQFSIAIFLISSLIVINKQVEHMKNADLGFNYDKVVAISGFNKKIVESYPAIMDALSMIPGIKSIGASSHMIGGGASGQGFKVVGSSSLTDFPINEYRVLPGFVETLGFKLIMGRAFDENIESDKNGVILNEKAAKMLGLSEPLKTELIMREKMHVIGIVKDFRYASFEQGIEPIMFTAYSKWLNYIMLKIPSNDVKSVLKDVENVIKAIDSQYVLDYDFVEDVFHSKFKSHEQTETLSAYASILSLILALLGLYALSMFMVQKRTKEIGIRKVNGASRLQIIRILLAAYTKQVAVAFVIAAPIAYYVLNSWLNNFAYRIELTFIPFIVSGLLALGVALLTVFGQSWSVASKNPVESLRCE